MAWMVAFARARVTDSANSAYAGLGAESFASVAGGVGVSAELEPLVEGGLSDAGDVGGGGEVVAGGDDFDDAVVAFAGQVGASASWVSR